jgi:hypothetical protein
MPGRMMRSMRSFQRDLDSLFGGYFGEEKKQLKAA